MQHASRFRVSVARDDLVFSSAHFITYAGSRCEGLHGHNYRVRVAVDGALDTDHLVFDFIELKRIMRELCRQIDHVVLLPTTNPRIAVVEEGHCVRVAVDGAARYVFPKADCALLPVPNTSVEMIAELLAGRLRAELEALGVGGLTVIEMEVEENFGQSAICRMEL